jgi:Peptidase family M48
VNAPFPRFALYGLTLALAWFTVVSVLATFAVAWTVRRLAARGTPSSTIWFALRVLPAALAGVFAAAIFLPSYWLFEPRDSRETLAYTVTTLAAIAIAAAVAAGVRGLRAWRRAARRARVWMRNARPLVLPGAGLPAFELDTDAPLLVLVGVLRPRLLVTRGLIAALTPEELGACVAHELAHSHGRDNLKRLAMQSLPDVLRLADAARALEQRWVASSEHRADRLASANDPGVRCALASALLKVARLTPAATPLNEPICALVGGGDLASRVRRLLEERGAPGRATHARLWIGALAVAIAATLYTPLLVSVHEATEILVRFLP